MSERIFSRRQVLARLGLSAAAIGGSGLFAGCGGGSSGLSEDPGTEESGAKATLDVWYHQYGEAGTQQAVERYAKEYPDATVNVQWTPGDYTSKLNSGLLSSVGSGRLRGQRQHRPGEERPGRAAGRHHRRREGRLHRGGPQVLDGRRQDLPDQDGRRHGRSLLPQERAGQGRCEAADDDRRADRGVARP